MALSRLIAGNCGVPLNCMCSHQCEIPVWPDGSSLEPTRYHTQELISGAVWISFKSTFNPFANTYSLKVFFMDYPHWKTYVGNKYKYLLDIAHSCRSCSTAAGSSAAGR